MIRPVAWRGSAVLIAVLLSLGTGTLVGVAMSQPPSPRSGNATGQPAAQSSQQNQSNPNTAPSGTDLNPFIVRANPTERQAAQDERDRFDQRINRWAVLGVGVLTMGVLVLQGYLLKYQNDIMVKQNATLADQLTTNQSVSRPYVKLSHERPVGGLLLDFRITVGHSGNSELWVSFTVKNEGATPADVLGGGIWFRLAEADAPPRDIPPHYPYAIAPVFLTGGGGDFVRDRVMLWFPTEAVEEFTNITFTGGRQLWLMGVVDYRDRFGGFHRAGYCRHFDKAQQDLVFDQSTSGLNYDRSMTPAERARYAE